MGLQLYTRLGLLTDSARHVWVFLSSSEITGVHHPHCRRLTRQASTLLTELFPQTPAFISVELVASADQEPTAQAKVSRVWKGTG